MFDEQSNVKSCFGAREDDSDARIQWTLVCKLNLTEHLCRSYYAVDCRWGKDKFFWAQLSCAPWISQPTWTRWPNFFSFSLIATLESCVENYIIFIFFLFRIDNRITFLLLFSWRCIHALVSNVNYLMKTIEILLASQWRKKKVKRNCDLMDNSCFSWLNFNSFYHSLHIWK